MQRYRHAHDAEHSMYPVSSHACVTQLIEVDPGFIYLYFKWASWTWALPLTPRGMTPKFRPIQARAGYRMHQFSASRAHTALVWTSYTSVPCLFCCQSQHRSIPASQTGTLWAGLHSPLFCPLAHPQWPSESSGVKWSVVQHDRAVTVATHPGTQLLRIHVLTGLISDRNPPGTSLGSCGFLCRNLCNDGVTMELSNTDTLGPLGCP